MYINDNNNCQWQKQQFAVMIRGMEMPSLWAYNTEFIVKWVVVSPGWVVGFPGCEGREGREGREGGSIPESRADWRTEAK